jgi:hypothetical protein
MTSKPVAFLLSDLGITRTHNRPYTSTDNPCSEAQFKTLKYRPAFPRRFDSIEHARAHCRDFFDDYNHHHRHSGIGLMTPATVHHGHAEQRRITATISVTRAVPGARFEHGWWIGRVAAALVARRTSGVESGHRRGRSPATSGMEQHLRHDSLLEIGSNQRACPRPSERMESESLSRSTSPT